ncbi:MAG TPA: MBL fold metallo-hydrolase [Gaiellaceae bacterium]|nr:MBL fold metallo-hydrolase [Gaiellaceae bacterium]
MQEIAPGLTQWIRFYDEWNADVASYALETGDGLVLLDPLDPPRELRRPAHVVLTLFYHARSTAELRPRRIWAPRRSVKPLERRGVRVTDVLDAGDGGPGAIRALASGRPSELAYWLPEQRALYAGDVLLGSPLRICPDSWVGKGGQTAVRAALEPALELPIARVLVSHGDPVLRGGRRALEQALLQAPSAA